MRKTLAIAAVLALASIPAMADSGGAPLQNPEAWRAQGVSCFNNISDPRLWDATIERLRWNEPDLPNEDIRILIPTAKVMVLQATGYCPGSQFAPMVPAASR